MAFITNYYVLSFIKFAILATLGEVIASSMRTKRLTIPHLLVARMIIWGLLGVWIAFMISLFAQGIHLKLSETNSAILHTKLAFAFITSLVMNASFGPVFMVLHKHTDTYLDLKYEGEKNITLQKICSKIDYFAYIKNVLIGTIPTFWLPAHTITFLLPEHLRVFFAALMSICLGILLTLKSK